MCITLLATTDHQRDVERIVQGLKQINTDDNFPHRWWSSYVELL